jgi:hypothetical protein
MRNPAPDHRILDRNRNPGLRGGWATPRNAAPLQAGVRPSGGPDKTLRHIPGAAAWWRRLTRWGDRAAEASQARRPTFVIPARIFRRLRGPIVYAVLYAEVPLYVGVSRLGLGRPFQPAHEALERIRSELGDRPVVQPSARGSGVDP